MKKNRDVEGAGDDQASLQATESDTLTNKNVGGNRDPLKEKIRKRIESSEGSLDISISSQITRPAENGNIYSMEGYMLRGVVYILNIKDFEGKAERRGSEMDVRNLRNLFGKLGYKIIKIEEVRKKEIEKKIDEIKNNMDLKKASNFIMFLMSHGDDNCLFDANGEKMPIYDFFFKPFSTCELLFNKPKLFFIQACRGKEKHSYEVDGPCEEIKENFISFDFNTKEKKNFSDFLMFNSTYVNHISIRMKNVGSVFIRCVVLTISYLCHQHSLNTIMNYVKDIMKNCKIPYKGQLLNQIASIDTNTLTKDFYFLPAATSNSSSTATGNEDSQQMKEKPTTTTTTNLEKMPKKRLERIAVLKKIIIEETPKKFLQIIEFLKKKFKDFKDFLRAKFKYIKSKKEEKYHGKLLEDSMESDGKTKEDIFETAKRDFSLMKRPFYPTSTVLCL